MNITVNQVIDFLSEAQKHTYDSNEKYHIGKCIDALYHMKESNCFKYLNN